MQALNDVWILGDKFLENMFLVLQAMKTSAVMEAKPVPYLYDMYNIFICFSNTTLHRNNVLLWTGSALIDTLNKRAKLPKYIILLIDRDLINMIRSFDCGITRELERSAAWLATQIQCNIDTRTEQLWHKRVVSVTLHPTKIIWVEMFDCPFNKKDPAIAIRNKLNKGINQVAQHFQNSHVMVIELVDKNKHFDAKGKINYNGKWQFWRELDFHFKQFDCKKDQLKPRNFVRNDQVNDHGDG